MENRVITIARSYGSGGRKMGRLLAKELGYEYYDREILRIASDESGISEELFRQADEKQRIPLFRIAREVYTGEVIPPDSDDFISNENLFRYQAKIIRELAATRNCVIVGRCANFILRGRDPNKDQSYFLSLMRPDQIARAVFPLGDLLKPEVRVLAEKYGLPTARKKDSQGICFIGQVKMSDFLRHYLPDKPGKIVDTEGRTLGTHNGLHLFTMGQRKGHGVASPREGVAYVVVGKDVQRNRLILGYEDASTRGLYASRAVVGGISHTLTPLPARVMAQPRYRAKAEWASCEYLEEGKVLLNFDTPLRALAVGQVCAFYDGGKLLGGGFFESIEP